MEKVVSLQKACTIGEFVVFLSVWVFMLLTPRGRRRCYWAKPDKLATDGLPGSNLGIFMPENRFAALVRCLAIGPEATEDDPFLPVRAFSEAIIKKMQTSIDPGMDIVPDESMIQCEGEMPGRMYVPRKPVEIGREYHAVADNETKIIINLEMVEGKERDRKKELVSEFGVATACTLRLTAPWKGTGRVVVADSWFAGVRTAEELYRRNGLYFIGMVKTGHKNFPRKLLWNKRGNMRGDLAAASCTTKDGIRLLAVNQNDFRHSQIIATCGTTLASKPRKARFSTTMPLVPRCDVTSHYYTRYPAVDLSNKSRQGSGCINQLWRSNKWEHCDFAGLFDFCIVNTYFHFTHFSGKVEATDSKQNPGYFRAILVRALQFNPHWREVLISLRTCAVLMMRACVHD